MFQTYKDAAGEWRWRLSAPNGKVIAVSAEGYKRRADCLKSIEFVKKHADAEIFEEGDEPHDQEHHK